MNASSRLAERFVDTRRWVEHVQPARSCAHEAPKRLAKPTQCTPPACSGVRGFLGQLLGACRGNDPPPASLAVGVRPCTLWAVYVRALPGAVRLPPTVPSGLGAAEGASHHSEGGALGEQLVPLGQLARDLLRRVVLPPLPVLSPVCSCWSRTSQSGWSRCGGPTSSHSTRRQPMVRRERASAGMLERSSPPVCVLDEWMPAKSASYPTTSRRRPRRSPRSLEPSKPHSSNTHASCRGSSEPRSHLAEPSRHTGGLDLAPPLIPSDASRTHRVFRGMGGPRTPRRQRLLKQASPP